MVWYYVIDETRFGPIEESEMLKLVLEGKIKEDDFVWNSSLDNWVKLNESNLKQKKSFFSSATDKIYFLKIGADRGALEKEYGPFDLATLKKLFKENRINSKTLIFKKNQTEWIPIEEIEESQEIFLFDKPSIDSPLNQRKNSRKPFIARLLYHDTKGIFEGICRDISEGGMQVLLDFFPGEIGEEIVLNVHPDNSDMHFTAHGKIVRILPGRKGFSFEFNSLSSDAKEKIKRYTEQV